MKKIVMLVALFLGTSLMVNAQTEPAKASSKKEAKEVKHAEKEKKAAEKKEKKAEKKAETAKTEAKK